MIPIVQPLILSQMDLPRLLSLGKSYLKRNLGASLDTMGERPGSFPSYIASLSCFQGVESTTPRKAIRSAISPLQHFSFAFIVLAEESTLIDLILLGSGRLAFTICAEHIGCVISANLSDWQWVLATYSNTQVSQDIRLILNVILSYFEQAGLGDLWSNYGKRSMDDGTHSLVKI